MGRREAGNHSHLSESQILDRIERVGDLSSNIAEEIIFYVEAKVLKHAETLNEPTG